MTFDSSNFLSAVIPFFSCGISVFYALCVSDDHACFFFSIIPNAYFADYFF